MRSAQRCRAIAEADVEYVFDEACIQALAVEARLPSGADLRSFGDGVRPPSEPMHDMPANLPVTSGMRNWKVFTARRGDAHAKR
jgi:hypothetical protein